MSDITNLLQKGKVFYKFTKTDENFKNIFSENLYTNYPENSIINANSTYGLAFCDDISHLLYCAEYGNQLTQIIFDEDSKYFDDIIKYTTKNSGEYNRFHEYDSFIVQTGKNYSLKDPSVLNEIIQNSPPEAIRAFLHKNINEFSMVDIYDNIGFFETANFVKALKEKEAEFLSNHTNLNSVYEEIKEYANSLITERNFSFKKAETEYNKNPVDRRREPTQIAKETEDFVSLCGAISHYLRSNRFTKNQTKIIMKTFLRSEKVNAKDINYILPKFVNSFSDKQLKQIYQFCDKNKNLSEIMDYIDGIYESKIPTQKLSLSDIIINFAKDMFKTPEQKQMDNIANDKINFFFDEIR